MTHLSWPTVPLGNILTERRETPSCDAIFNGEVPIVSKIGFSDGQIELREDSNTKTNMILIEPGDLVTSGINAAKGAIAIYDKKNDRPIAATIHYGAYIPDKNKVDVRYLWLFLRSRNFQEILAEKVPGGIKTELKAKRFLPIPIPLPPLPEQRRIVARIDELAARIEEAKGLREKTNLQPSAVMASKATLIFESVKKRVPLGDNLFELIYRYPTFYNISYIEDGVGLLKIGNLTQESWNIDFKNQKTFISVETSNAFPRTILEAGDLIMAARGATIGKTAYVTSEFSGFNINANLLRLKPNPTRLDGKYFWHFIKSPLGQEQFQVLVTSTAKETITVPKLKTILVPLPSIEKQQKIVQYLDDLQAKINSLKKLQAETEKELNALLPSILDKAFKGKL